MKLFDYVKNNVDSINKFEQQEFNWVCKKDGTQFEIIRQLKKDNGKVVAVLNEIPQSLSRNAVAECMREDIYKGFLAVLLWGGMHKYVFSRRHFLTAIAQQRSTVIDILKRVKGLIDKGNLEEAYVSMCNGAENHIKGVGPSYFTKIMYFLGYGNKGNMRPFIYDSFLKYAHFALMVGRDENPFYYYVPVDDGFVYAEYTTPAEVYVHYCKTMIEVSRELGIQSPSNLEAWLFSRRTPGGATPRMVAKKDVESLGETGFIQAHLQDGDIRDAMDLSRIFYDNNIKLMKEWMEDSLGRIGRDATRPLIINEKEDYVHLEYVISDLLFDLQEICAECKMQELLVRGNRRIDRLDFLVESSSISPQTNGTYSLYFDITAGYDSMSR